MPRRRLHGETQKRRQKLQTARLKRSQSAHRVAATQAPSAFERTGKLERQDVEFLEAMRELRVQPNPLRAIPPERLRAVERVIVEDADSASTEFLAAMTNLGVRPLAGDPDNGDPDNRDNSGGASRAAKTLRPRAAREEPGPVPSTRGERGPSRTPDGAPHPAQNVPGPAPRGAAPPPTLTAEPVRAGSAKQERPAVSRPAAPEPVTFQEGGPSMADLLAAEWDPAHKYEGAPPRPERPVQAGPRRAAEDAEPDDTLDLHGKTQEEAIRMVQNFLLTAHRRRCRHVLLITGRGLRSGEHGPVLRDAVRIWLERNGERFVKEFRPAPGRHGGEGAIWVEMR